MMKKVFLIRTVILFLVLQTNSVSSQVHELIVDQNRVITPAFIGNGAQWAAYPHCDTENEEKGFTFGPISEKEYRRVERRLEKMHPNFMRIMIHPGWRYFNGLNEEGKPVVDYENEEQQWLYKILDFCEKNGVTVLFGEWAPRSHKADGKSGGKWVRIWEDYNPVWAELIASHIQYLIEVKQYTCIKYYDMENEPYLGYAFSGGQFEKYLNGMKLLDAALKEKGIRDRIKLNCSWGHYQNRRDITPEQVKRISAYADVYDEHYYVRELPVKGIDYEDDFTAQIKKVKTNDPSSDGFFLGECNFKILGLKELLPNTGRDHTTTVFQWENGIYMANLTVQAMRSGVLGVIAWDVDDAIHTQDDNGTELKRWGFWDSMGEEYSNDPSLERTRPWTAAWTLLCRYFPTGSQILDVTDLSEQGIYATAALTGKGLSIVIINPDQQYKKVKVKMKEDFLVKKLNRFDYSKGKCNVDKDGFPIPSETLKDVDLKDGIELVFPESGIVLLTELKNK